MVRIIDEKIVNGFEVIRLDGKSFDIQRFDKIRGNATKFRIISILNGKTFTFVPYDTPFGKEREKDFVITIDGTQANLILKTREAKFNTPKDLAHGFIRGIKDNSFIADIPADLIKIAKDKTLKAIPGIVSPYTKESTGVLKTTKSLPATILETEYNADGSYIVFEYNSRFFVLKSAATDIDEALLSDFEMFEIGGWKNGIDSKEDLIRELSSLSENEELAYKLSGEIRVEWKPLVSYGKFSPYGKNRDRNFNPRIHIKDSMQLRVVKKVESGNTVFFTSSTTTGDAHLWMIREAEIYYMAAKPDDWQYGYEDMAELRSAIKDTYMYTGTDNEFNITTVLSLGLAKALTATHNNNSPKLIDIPGQAVTQAKNKGSEEITTGGLITGKQINVHWRRDDLTIFSISGRYFAINDTDVFELGVAVDDSYEPPLQNAPLSWDFGEVGLALMNDPELVSQIEYRVTQDDFSQLLKALSEVEIEEDELDQDGIDLPLNLSDAITATKNNNHKELDDIPGSAHIKGTASEELDNNITEDGLQAREPIKVHWRQDELIVFSIDNLYFATEGVNIFELGIAVDSRYEASETDAPLAWDFGFKVGAFFLVTEIIDDITDIAAKSSDEIEAGTELSKDTSGAAPITTEELTSELALEVDKKSSASDVSARAQVKLKGGEKLVVRHYVHDSYIILRDSINSYIISLKDGFAGLIDNKIYRIGTYKISLSLDNVTEIINEVMRIAITKDYGGDIDVVDPDTKITTPIHKTIAIMTTELTQELASAVDLKTPLREVNVSQPVQLVNESTLVVRHYEHNSYVILCDSTNSYIISLRDKFAGLTDHEIYHIGSHNVAITLDSQSDIVSEVKRAAKSDDYGGGENILNEDTVIKIPTHHTKKIMTTKLNPQLAIALSRQTVFGSIVAQEATQIELTTFLTVKYYVQGKYAVLHDGIKSYIMSLQGSFAGLTDNLVYHIGPHDIEISLNTVASIAKAILGATENGEKSHTFTSAPLELPDVSDEITTIYDYAKQGSQVTIGTGTSGSFAGVKVPNGVSVHSYKTGVIALQTVRTLKASKAITLRWRSKEGTTRRGDKWNIIEQISASDDIFAYALNDDASHIIYLGQLDVDFNYFFSDPDVLWSRVKVLIAEKNIAYGDSAETLAYNNQDITDVESIDDLSDYSQCPFVIKGTPGEENIPKGKLSIEVGFTNEHNNYAIVSSNNGGDKRWLMDGYADLKIYYLGELNMELFLKSEFAHLKTGLYVKRLTPTEPQRQQIICKPIALDDLPNLLRQLKTEWTSKGFTGDIFIPSSTVVGSTTVYIIFKMQVASKTNIEYHVRVSNGRANNTVTSKWQAALRHIGLLGASEILNPNSDDTVITTRYELDKVDEAYAILMDSHLNPATSFTRTTLEIRVPNPQKISLDYLLLLQTRTTDSTSLFKYSVLTASLYGYGLALSTTTASSDSADVFTSIGSIKSYMRLRSKISLVDAKRLIVCKPIAIISDLTALISSIESEWQKYDFIGDIVIPVENSGNFQIVVLTTRGGSRTKVIVSAKVITMDGDTPVNISASVPSSTTRITESLIIPTTYAAQLQNYQKYMLLLSAYFADRKHFTDRSYFADRWKITSDAKLLHVLVELEHRLRQKTVVVRTETASNAT